MIATAIQWLNSDELDAALNAYWTVESIIVVAFICSPSLRRWLRRKFWS